MSDREFIYTIPVGCLKDSKRRTVTAWRTICPGLIVQGKIDFTGMALVHQHSGFVITRVKSIREGEWKAGVLLGIGIDWTLTDAFEIESSVRLLSDLEIVILHLIRSGMHNPGCVRRYRECAEAKSSEHFNRRVATERADYQRTHR